MNLTTRYMGLTLKNPMVASASPLSQSVDTIRRLEDHGASAVVMFSLFEEQIRHDMESLDHFMSVGRDSFGEALSYFPVVDDHAVGPTQYLGWMEKKGYESASQLRGSMSQRSIPESMAFVRGNYIKILESYKPSSK
jgi:dihydroorotate dehydrogenase (fumarate)